MKVSLVVASGVHQGKVIAITGPQFLIGRDPECHLRPASQAVSKKHCGFLVRDGQVYLKDFGSTNGTTLNATIVRNEERLLKQGDSVQVGPLDFTLRLEIEASKEDGTPLPDLNPETAAALAAVKAVTGGAATTTGDRTPTPKAPGAKPSGGSKPAPALKTGSKETQALKTSSADETTAGDADQDRIAAMMLGLTDDDVPEGGTIVDMPAVDEKGEPIAVKTEPEKKDPKKIQSREDTSNAASEILRKYMRRPK